MATIKHILIGACLLTAVSTASHAQSLSAQYFNKVADKVLNRDSEISMTAAAMINFAYNLVGIPYKWGDENPNEGMDCSGFVGYVFKTFGYRVPRVSRDYAAEGVTVPVAEARPGDILLFTGSNLADRTIGHMAIISSTADNNISFIHSSSGKNRGVTLSKLSEGYYQKRLIKIVRLITE